MKYKLKSRPSIPKLASGSQMPATSVIGAASSMASTLVDLLPDASAGNGITYQSQGKSIGKGALAGAASGATIGSVVPGIGTAIGAGVGALVGGLGGLISSTKEKKQAEKQSAVITRQKGSVQDKLSQQYYASVPAYKSVAYGKNGMKIAQNQDERKSAFMSDTVPTSEEKAVVLSGQRHSEKGKFGNGNPGINEKGEKIVEVEKGELLLTIDQTQVIESLVSAYKNNPSPAILIQLGKEFQRFVQSAKK